MIVKDSCNGRGCRVTRLPMLITTHRFIKDAQKTAIKIKR